MKWRSIKKHTKHTKHTHTHTHTHTHAQTQTSSRDVFNKVKNMSGWADSKRSVIPRKITYESL